MNKKDTHKTICIPFYKTGYCGYGKDCLYLHIREDDMDLNLENDLYVELCGICQNKLINGVKTQCNHSFCLECFINSYKNNPKCFICKLNTFGRLFPIN
ncbi:zinc finger domain-containing protein [Tubulinosema ratisbonensis]|uniref:Pre-mRNA-splicing factor CWC24 n=1 Tax=Tubulinosema ratisbonensis TaxID=291195 RepID=A0A437AHY8_9MICR|nr:zinc finger domain-containing protein [Tubulinosema ratisbonensis]